MGKAAIVYYSQHHGNTKILLDAIAGFDTFGPFKLVGGLQKGHPTEEELKGAIEFYKNHLLFLMVLSYGPNFKRSLMRCEKIVTREKGD